MSETDENTAAVMDLEITIKGLSLIVQSLETSVAEAKRKKIKKIQTSNWRSAKRAIKLLQDFSNRLPGIIQNLEANQLLDQIAKDDGDEQ